MVSPQTLLDTFQSIDNQSLTDALLKSSLNRMATRGVHQQLLLARSLLFPSSSSPLSSSSSSSRPPSSATHYSPLSVPPPRFFFKGRSGRLEWDAINKLDLDKIIREVCIL